jgi:hypothetical protein
LERRLEVFLELLALRFERFCTLLFVLFLSLSEAPLPPRIAHCHRSFLPLPELTVTAGLRKPGAGRVLSDPRAQ